MAPITGFFGTNSSGKTAILQFLLMLKQTVESSDRQRILHMGGDNQSYVDLGTSYDIIYQHILPGTISFSLTWHPPISQPKLELCSGVVLADEAKYFWSSKDYTHIQFESEIYIDMTEIHVQKMVYQYTLENTPPLTADDFSEGYFSKEVKIGINVEEGHLFISPPTLEDVFLKNQSLYPAPLNSYQYYISNSPEVSPVSNLEQSFENLFQNLYYLGPQHCLFFCPLPQEMRKLGLQKGGRQIYRNRRVKG